MSVEELNSALVGALGSLQEPHKAGRAAAGAYSYSYLTLSDLSSVVRAAFAAHGLAFTQHVETHDTLVRVTTRVLHVSGSTWTTDPLTMVARDRSPQSLGSAVSYCRRYQLAALVGLSGSDDDDGHAAQPQTAPAGVDTPSPGPPAGAPNPAPAAPRDAGKQPGAAGVGTRSEDGPTAAQLRMLNALLAGHGAKAPEARHAYVQGIVQRSLGSVSDLSKREVSLVIDALKAEPAERLDRTPDDDEFYQQQLGEP